MSQSIEVNLAGLKLNINTDDNPQQVLAAAKMVQEQFDALKNSGTIIDTSKIMALIALNLADDLLNKEQSNPANMKKLISSLDQAVAQAQGLANVSLR
ncbi:MAG: cell division protein ZapA [Ghiorsea sp.]